MLALCVLLAVYVWLMRCHFVATLLQAFLASATPRAEGSSSGGSRSSSSEGGGGGGAPPLPPMSAFEAEINKYKAIQEEIQVGAVPLVLPWRAAVPCAQR